MLYMLASYAFNHREVSFDLGPHLPQQIQAQSLMV